MPKLLLGCLMLFLSLTVTAGSLTWEQKHHQLEEVAQLSYDTSHEQVSAVEKLYRSLFSALDVPGEIKKLSDVDLRSAFDATNLAAFFTSDVELTARMQALLSLMEHKRLATSTDVQAVFGQFIQGRQFAEAERFRETHPSTFLASLPTISGKVNSRYPIVLSPTGENELHRLPIAVDQGIHIVVVAHPLCHFSQNAVRAIEKDSALSSLFARYATFILPPARSLDLALVRNWNKEHPAVPMHLAYKTKDWPLLDTWATPTFYFFRNGSLIAKLVGWPREGRMPELKRDIQKVGLIRLPD